MDRLPLPLPNPVLGRAKPELPAESPLPIGVVDIRLGRDRWLHEAHASSTCVTNSWQAAEF